MKNRLKKRYLLCIFSICCFLFKGDFAYSKNLILRGSVVSDTYGILNYFILDAGGLSVKVLCSGKCSFKRGDIVEVYGILFKPSRFKNPGNFFGNTRSYTLLKASGVKKIGFNPGSFYFLHSFRRKAVERLLSINTPSAKMACALVFGAREVLGANEKRVFYKLGLGHILAVSGFHFGVILGAIYFVLLFTLRVVNLVFQFPFHILPTRCAHILNIPFSFMFLVLTGAQISAQRAFVMYVIFVLLFLCEREAILKKVAFTSFVLLLMLKPSNIKDLGFQLSFIAIFAIAFIWEKIKDKGSFQKFLAITVFTSVSVSPLVAFYFHKFHPLSVISNLIMLPIFTLLIPILFAFSFINILIPSAQFLFFILDTLWKPLFSFMRYLSNLEIASIWITRTETLVLVLFICFIYLIIFKNRLLILAIFIVILMTLLSYLTNTRDKAVFFDLGRRGNAALVICGNKKILVDAGGLSKAGRKSLLFSLLWLDARAIDSVIIRAVSKAHSEYLSFLKENITLKKIEMMHTNKARSFDICGVRFVLSEKGCGNSSVCYVKNGLVYVKGKKYLTWHSGALITSLEE